MAEDSYVKHRLIPSVGGGGAQFVIFADQEPRTVAPPLPAGLLGNAPGAGCRWWTPHSLQAWLQYIYTGSQSDF